MDKLIILGLIGYLIWSNSSDQTTEPANKTAATEPQTQNVNNPVNSVNLDQQQTEIVNLVANQIQTEEPRQNAGNVRLTPPDLYSYQKYEDFDRYLTA